VINKEGIRLKNNSARLPYNGKVLYSIVIAHAILNGFDYQFTREYLILTWDTDKVEEATITINRQTGRFLYIMRFYDEAMRGSIGGCKMTVLPEEDSFDF